MNSLAKKYLSDNLLLAVLPLMVVCKTAPDALLAAAIIVIALPLTDLSARILHKLLNSSALLFARMVFAVGYIGILATVCTLFAKTQVENLGIYLYLPAVTTLFFAMEKNETSLPETLKDSAISSASFFVVLFISGILREFLGLGSLFGVEIYTKLFAPIGFFASPAGGLFTAAIFLILCRVISCERGKECVNE
ncbi:MAG: Rnf-Nqr domain containing protein [Acutalibacteraceae bacterium]|nr:Rnf-Nqr domain containing protein [Acutalibacteraceae bacterium]